MEPVRKFQELNLFNKVKNQQFRDKCKFRNQLNKSRKFKMKMNKWMKSKNKPNTEMRSVIFQKKIR